MLYKRPNDQNDDDDDDDEEEYWLICYVSLVSRIK